MKIKKLTLFTNSLEKQYQFYAQTLGATILSKTVQQFDIKIGDSILSFVEKENHTPYHFAINIPSNQENHALKWLKQKVSILKYNDKEIVDFPDWNAKAIYFYDQEKNIVEFIARKNLQMHTNAMFDASSLFEISEIGVVSTNVTQQYQFLSNTLGISKYSGDTHRFCAIGSENGLFICIDNSKKDWFPTNDKAFSSDFNINIKVSNTTYELLFKNQNFTLINS